MEMVKQLTLRSRANSGIMQTEFTPRLPSLERVGFNVPPASRSPDRAPRRRPLALHRNRGAPLSTPVLHTPFHILFIPIFAGASH